MHSTTNHSSKSTAHNSAKSRYTSVPLDLFKSGRLLALKPNCRGALIIQKPFYADFAGPGAAVGGTFDFSCTSVYAIGEVEFYAPASYAERQQAFQKRMDYSQKLEEILAVPSPIHRVRAILKVLSQGLQADLVKMIPSNLIAQLGGVLTKTVEIARQQPSIENRKRDFGRGREQFPALGLTHSLY